MVLNSLKRTRNPEPKDIKDTTSVVTTRSLCFFGGGLYRSLCTRFWRGVIQKSVYEVLEGVIQKSVYEVLDDVYGKSNAI